MSLTSNLVVALGLLFAIFIISQLIYLAMRMHHSRLLNRQRQRQRQRLDRQNNVELGRDHRSFGDIFFIEPNSPEAARIREQLEKDDKDLPSYDEVMRMCNLTSPTAAAAPATPTTTTTLAMEPTAIGIAALPAPPYTERDPNANVDTSVAVNAMEQSPSTSRAAQVST